MTAAEILLATARFVCWEAALFAASIRLARWLGWGEEQGREETWLAILSVEVTLEASVAGVFSFAKANAAAGYWAVAAFCAVLGFRHVRGWADRKNRWSAPLLALVAPLILLSFRPVEEIDSINYLHYLIDWMGNRATPYTFATNYVAFWELSFLPAWVVTRVDLFFPLIALKAVLLLGLAAWLVGRELGLKGRLLALTVFGSLMMRHYWWEYSGVPTLKNDALHGVGFALIALVLVRAARRMLTRTDIWLLTLGAAFASVKYTGIFLAVLAFAIVVWRGPRTRLLWSVPAVLVLTSGHYYVKNLVLYGSPFYPFQINIGFIHLPGTADLSYSSILYNLRDPRLWRAFFWPQGGVSPAGLFFPAIMAGSLVLSAWRLFLAAWRRKMAPADWAVFAILCGWLLYFRSVYSACAGPGDLAFVLNSLNSVRYVDGVLTVSELFLVAMLARYGWLAVSLVGINAASRLAMLYAKETLPWAVVLGVAVGVAVVAWAVNYRSLAVELQAAALILGGPFLVEWNRAQWTTYWNDLKPALQRVRGPDLAELALPDGGYFAGHLVAAGNPVDASVRSLMPEELAAARPRYVAVLVTPGSEIGNTWESRYGTQFQSWGYRILTKSKAGALLERQNISLQ